MALKATGLLIAVAVVLVAVLQRSPTKAPAVAAPSPSPSSADAVTPPRITPAQLEMLGRHRGDPGSQAPITRGQRAPRDPIVRSVSIDETSRDAVGAEPITAGPPLAPDEERTDAQAEREGGAPSPEGAHPKSEVGGRIERVLPATR